mmetsp:Transcript_42225/g.55638  ORF Transcript_42225/g.55638 Transcript_42225/m.55638 type:complete len:92 (-) Transcript_42225:1291-1566(-)
MAGGLRQKNSSKSPMKKNSSHQAAKHKLACKRTTILRELPQSSLCEEVSSNTMREQAAVQSAAYGEAEFKHARRSVESAKHPRHYRQKHQA